MPMRVPITFKLVMVRVYQSQTSVFLLSLLLIIISLFTIFFMCLNFSKTLLAFLNFYMTILLFLWNLILLFVFSRTPSPRPLLLRPNALMDFFYIPLRHISTSPPQAFLGIRASANTWHARLGHPSISTTLHLLNSQKLPCNSNKFEPCNDCYMAKAH